jgi:LacI family transcriptional regulator
LRWFWVAAALRFIAEHSHEDIRVDDVAKHVRATVRSLERYFRAATGRTMTEEIARLRLERAKRLLVESKEPISPGEYRRRRRSG